MLHAVWNWVEGHPFFAILQAFSCLGHQKCHEHFAVWKLGHRPSFQALLGSRKGDLWQVESNCQRVILSHLQMKATVFLILGARLPICLEPLPWCELRLPKSPRKPSGIPKPSGIMPAKRGAAWALWCWLRLWASNWDKRHIQEKTKTFFEDLKTCSCWSQIWPPAPHALSPETSGTAGTAGAAGAAVGAAVGAAGGPPFCSFSQHLALRGLEWRNLP